MLCPAGSRNCVWHRVVRATALCSQLHLPPRLTGYPQTACRRRSISTPPLSQHSTHLPACLPADLSMLRGIGEDGGRDEVELLGEDEGGDPDELAWTIDDEVIKQSQAGKQVRTCVGGLGGLHVVGRLVRHTCTPACCSVQAGCTCPASRFAPLTTPTRAPMPSHLPQEAYAEKSPKEMEEIAAKEGYGRLFSTFKTVADGLYACDAVDSLVDASAIDTLLSNFIVPLQSDDISKPDASGNSGVKRGRGWWRGARGWGWGWSKRQSQPSA